MYSIQLLEPEISTFYQQQVQQALQQAIYQDGRFRVGRQHWGSSKLTRKERTEAKVDQWECTTLFFQRIRLTAAKPYCGNHPGPCQLTGRKKPNATYLEWDDWVEFHTLVNRALNSLQVLANVWTLPPDAKGKMWIRKGSHCRIRWEWEEKRMLSAQGARFVRVWNTGTPDQFTTQPYTFFT